MEIQGNDQSCRLRAHRARHGMTQQEVVDALQRLAWLRDHKRVGVNADMVSKWERGTKRPSRLYLRLLCSLFEATPEDLGLAPASAPSVILPAVVVPAATEDPLRFHMALDEPGVAVELLQPKLLELWRDDVLTRRQLLKAMGLAPAAGGLDAIDAQLPMLPVGKAPTFRGAETVAQVEGLIRHLEVLYHSSDPRILLLPVQGLVGTVEDFLPDVRDRVLRTSLLSALTRANLLAGRLSFFDLHQPLQARAYLDLAREASQDAGDEVLTAVLFGHMAFLPAEKRNFTAAASCLSRARESLVHRPIPLVSSWLSAIESEMSTKAGATSSALRCLAQAEADLPRRAGVPAPEWFDYFDERRLHGFAGFGLRRSGDLSGARAHLETALVPGPQVTPKQRAVSMIDLAVTCVEGGDVDEGCRLATIAAEDLHRAGYATAVDRLTEFRGALPDQRHPAARLLQESIADLS